MAKTQLTPDEIELLEAEINGSNDLERHEYRSEKYVDYVIIESKLNKKKLKKTYKYEGNGINKKLKNIEKTQE